MGPRNWDTKEYKSFVNYLRGLPLLEYILFALPKHLQTSESKRLREDLADHLSRLRVNPSSYSWQFLEDWACRHMLLQDKSPTSVRALEFRMRCIATAAEIGKSKVVRLIMEAGVNDLSETLLAASKCGDVASVRFIFDRGQTDTLTTAKDVYLRE